MLNQAWWTHLAVFNMSHWKRVRAIDSFFARNRSQSESEKKDTEEQCINQEETDEVQRKRKKITKFPENLVARSRVVVLRKGGDVQSAILSEI